MAKIIGAKAICEKLGVTESTFMQLVTAGQLPASKNPKSAQWEIDEKKLEKFGVRRAAEQKADENDQQDTTEAKVPPPEKTEPGDQSKPQTEKETGKKGK